MGVIDLKLKTYDELTFEIARLNTDKYLLEQKLQQKENIIKEVREYIKTLDYENEETYDIGEYTRNELLEILGESDK